MIAGGMIPFLQSVFQAFFFIDPEGQNPRHSWDPACLAPRLSIIVILSHPKTKDQKFSLQPPNTFTYSSQRKSEKMYLHPIGGSTFHLFFSLKKALSTDILKLRAGREP